MSAVAALGINSGRLLGKISEGWRCGAHHAPAYLNPATRTAGEHEAPRMCHPWDTDKRVRIGTRKES